MQVTQVTSSNMPAMSVGNITQEQLVQEFNFIQAQRITQNMLLNGLITDRDNDHRAVTIECASDLTEPYAMNDKVYASLVELCADICRRNGKKKLLWIADRDKALNYEVKPDEMLLTVHRWFAKKSCPGNWLFGKLGDLAQEVNSRLGV